MTVDPTRKLGLSLDPAALNALKTQSQNAPQAALRSVAKQFEAVFLNMMLKSMRETVSNDGVLDNQQTRMFTGMLDEQYASQLTQGRGLGLADMIVRQLSPAAGAAAAASGTGAGGVQDPAVSVPASPASLPAAAASFPAAAGGQPGSRSSLAPGASPLPGANPLAASAPASFRAEMAAHAAAASTATGIPADFMIAQAGLESGWGQHQPLTADGQPSHNLFGIKAGANWHGPVVKAGTSEVVDGRAQRVVQSFRAYGSYAEAFQDYAGLLSGSARYSRALTAGTAQDFAGALQKAGYATDPGYAGKLEGAIRQLGEVRA